mmetsp:Transcript_87318/g.282708  ORF Transcript_87318/g.282708 Transcript_87318/m.282708 type:complete len:134 (-) Transcript_87318:106-507(-)
MPWRLVAAGPAAALALVSRPTAPPKERHRAEGAAQPKGGARSGNRAATPAAAAVIDARGGEYDEKMMREIARSEADDIPHAEDYLRDSPAPAPRPAQGTAARRAPAALGRAAALAVVAAWAATPTSSRRARGR